MEYIINFICYINSIICNYFYCEYSCCYRLLVSKINEDVLQISAQLERDRANDLTGYWEQHSQFPKIDFKEYTKAYAAKKDSVKRKLFE